MPCAWNLAGLAPHTALAAVQEVTPVPSISFVPTNTSGIVLDGGLSVCVDSYLRELLAEKMGGLDPTF